MYKTFEQLASLLLWWIAAAMDKNPSSGKKARLYFTLYCIMYMVYFLYARSVVLQNQDKRPVQVLPYHHSKIYLVEGEGIG